MATPSPTLEPTNSRLCFEPPAPLTIVAGKGGVGKTTVSAALALACASAGLDTLVLEVEEAGRLGPLLGVGQLGYEQRLVCERGVLAEGSGRLEARAVTPDEALVEYLVDHGLRRLSNRLSSTGTLDLVATAVPGIKDILVLGKIKQLEQRAASNQPGHPQAIVVDAPAAGHAVTFLTSAYGLMEAAAVGPIQAQAAEVVAMLGDPDRCQVMLVTLAEETPVNEAAQTAFLLEDKAGVKLCPVVVNGLWPELNLPEDPVEALAEAGWTVDEVAASELARATRFRRARQALQRSQLKRLEHELPLRQVHLPFLFGVALERPDLLGLAACLADQLSGQGS